MEKEKILDLLDDTMHWLKILGLKGIEKEIVEGRNAIEIEHYHETISFNVRKNYEIIGRLKNLRDSIAKKMRNEKIKKDRRIL